MTQQPTTSETQVRGGVVKILVMNPWRDIQVTVEPPSPIERADPHHHIKPPRHLVRALVDGQEYPLSENARAGLLRLAGIQESETR
mgnify:CR=1 FL=1